MFYDKFITLCNEKSVKPTPVIKALGISTSYLKRWQNGLLPNAVMLQKLSEYFDVPIDYFFDENNDSKYEVFADKDMLNISFNSMFRIMQSHPDHIISMIAMFTVGPGVLERISKYMSCDIDCLINTRIKVDENNKAQSVKSTKEIILDILNALPGNKEYKNLQVYISTVIITNLLKLGIGKSKLIEAGLVVKKIEKLYDFEADSSTKTPLNLSDLMILSNKLAINYDTMLTGRVVKISEDE